MVLTEDDCRQEIAREWWFRAWAERDSTLRFTRLHQALQAEGVPEAIVDACETAAADEARHALLCAEVARGFHEQDPYAEQAAEGETLGPAALRSEERLLYEVIAFCCVTESLNAALLLTIYEAASHDVVRDATHRLARDEVQHARLGWAYLAHRVEQGADVSFLAPYVSRILTAAASENLTESDAFCAQWADPALGYLPRERRVEVFGQCVTDVIIPGLARYGVPTAQAEGWVGDQSWLAP